MLKLKQIAILVGMWKFTSNAEIAENRFGYLEKLQ